MSIPSLHSCGAVMLMASLRHLICVSGGRVGRNQARDLFLWTFFPCSVVLKQHIPRVLPFAVVCPASL